MRLDKYLADCGLGTRKDVKSYIKNGRISVDGKIAVKSDMQIDENNDEICIDGKKTDYKKYIYLMLNKPDGYVSATYDKKLPVVVELIDEKYRHYEAFPIGRLDIDTTGLLILTNDGALAHRLTSPKHHADKVYYAAIAGRVDESDIEAFNKGITLDDGYVCMSADLLIINSGEISEIELTIREGKFHQVKRMFEAVGKSVLSLKRLSMGGVELDESLSEGEIRELKDDEIEKLKRI